MAKAAGRPTLSAGAVRAAMRAAQRMTRGWESVVGVGLAYKHSSKGGYGARPTLCVLVTVCRKSKRPPSGERVPKRVRFAYRGRRYRVPTDVESRGRFARHVIAKCRARDPASALDVTLAHGSAGFLLRNQGRVLYLVTAGHVLCRTDGNPSTNDVVSLDQHDVGAVIGPLTHFNMAPGNSLLDVGVIRLDDVTTRVKAALNQPPWTTMKEIVSQGELLDALVEERFIRYRAYGAVGADVSAKMIGLELVPRSIDVVEGSRRLLQKYAPVLIDSETVGKHAAFCPGDSGSPIVDDKGRLYGIHILGRGGLGCRKRGFALAADSILTALRNLLDPTLELARFTELP